MRWPAISRGLIIPSPISCGAITRAAILAAVTLSFGCDSAANQELAPIGYDQSPAPVTEPAQADIYEDDVSFQDLLAQYQALNERLEDVSYKIQSANAQLCPVTDRSVGMTVHSVFDYPENLQPYARGLLNVDERLSLRTVRAGSTANAAGLLPADQLVQVAGTYLPSGRTAKTLFDALSARTYAQDSLDIKISRGGDLSTHTLAPETVCGYPVNLFFSERINGHTDGDEVWITSELMRSLPDDVDLALVIAHEMAHAIAGHMDKAPTKTLELEADRMALIMLARADYDIDQAVKNWRRAPHPDEGSFPSSTHPSQAERLAHFEDVKRSIETRLSSGQALNFEN